MTKKQTPLTLEVFKEVLMPQIKTLTLETFEEVLMPQIKTLTLETFEEVLMPQIKTLISESHDDLEEKIKHLPTREQYYAREDKTMGELKKLREEVSLTGHHYKSTNKRVDFIDKHLGIDTSTVF